MFVIKYKNIFFAISALVVGLSLASIFYFGLNLGIDFTGGSILEVSYSEDRPTVADISDKLAGGEFADVTLQPAGEKNLIIKRRELSQDQKEVLLKSLVTKEGDKVTEVQFSSIGPTISSNLAQKAVVAVILVSLLIILFIAVVFRHVSRPVSSWKYGVIAIVTLLHDIIIPTGVFALLGYFYSIEIDALFLTAVLTILGLSVNDTIVVFDRIRENLRNKISPHFADTVGISLNQTFTRSINTSMTVVIVLLALYFLGGPTTKYFALALTIGMVVGTYSSIFLASPLLVTWERWSAGQSK